MTQKQEYKVKQRLYAVSILRQMKRNRTYEELSKELGEFSEELKFEVPVLSRYIMGRVLPSNDRAKIIVDKYKSLLREEVKKAITINPQGHFNHLPLLYNINLLHHIAQFVASEFSFVKISKILSISTDGLPIAFLTGFELGVDVVYAKKKKEIGVEKFIEQRVIIEESAYSYSIFIPVHSLKKNENVLIVDDAIRSSTTIMNLRELCSKAKANPVGVFSIISINGGAKKVGKKVPFPVKTLIKL